MQNDLISRSALLKDLRDKGWLKGDLTDGATMIAVQAIIDAAPTIDPESLRPKGHWNIRHYSIYDSWTGKEDEEFYLECSECRREVRDIDQASAMSGDYRKLIEQYPYCHCGCKMEG